ncbi:MAG TPA: hypothetical protein EYG79_03900 [Rhodobacteraceae bacterium]|nr:hypothetical protein [Paracoccaceae bacterium]
MRFLSILFLLGACGAVSLSTLVQLSRLSPLTADPSGFVAAIVLPVEMDVPESGATLGFVWVSDAETIGGDYPLQRHSAFDGHGIEPDAGQQVLFFDLSKADAAKIRQAQQEIIARTKTGIDGEGSFSIFAAPCAKGVPAAPLISTYLRIEDGGPFLPLLQNYDFRQEVPEGLLSELAMCG